MNFSKSLILYLLFNEEFILQITLNVCLMFTHLVLSQCDWYPCLLLHALLPGHRREDASGGVMQGPAALLTHQQTLCKGKSCVLSSLPPFLQYVLEALPSGEIKLCMYQVSACVWNLHSMS